MIIVKVELVSAIHSSRNRQLAEMHITNDGNGTDAVGHYDVRTFGENGKPARKGRVENYRRKEVAVLNLVRQAIEAAGYTK
jgi:hypothetical protein